MTARAYDAATANCLGAGVWVEHASLSQPAPIEVTTWGDFERQYIASPGPTELELALVADSDGLERTWAALSEHMRARTQVGQQGLGSGHVCRFCNTTYMTGVLQCPQCGGETELRSKVLLARTDGDIYRLDMDFPHAGYARIRVGLYISQPLSFTSHNWRDLILYSLFMRPDHWLCPFCGLFVEAEKHTCPGCGGNRLPVKELAGLERVCIYCGKVTRGGYCCPRCNGRLKPSLAYFRRKI